MGPHVISPLSLPDAPSSNETENISRSKEKLLLLEEGFKDMRRYPKPDKSIQAEKWKYWGEQLCESLSILWTAREDKSTAWRFLQIIERLASYRYQLLEASHQERFIRALDIFARNTEDWQNLEAYAEEEGTVDIELNAIALKAGQLVCKIKASAFTFDTKLMAYLEGGKSGQCIAVLYKPYSFSSAYGLTQGVHFFETVVLTEHDCKICWNTCLHRLHFTDYINEERLIREDYDPFDDRHCIYIDSSFPPGTVLGCLLDFTQRTIAFYVNGRKLMLPESAHFSCNAYYIQVTSPLLYLNFGEVPFKYPPPEFDPCRSATCEASQTNKYALYDDVDMGESKPLFENRVEPFYKDATQRKVKEALEQLWKRGEITEEKINKSYYHLWNETFQHPDYSWRWVQAIIEMENIAPEKVTDWALLVKEIFNHTGGWGYEDFTHFFLSYSKLRLATGDTPTMYLTLAILFANILQYDRTISSSLASFLTSFLLSAFLTTTDPSTAMFTLIGLETVKKEEMQKLKNTEFTEKLKYWKEIDSLPQLHLVIQHFELSFHSADSYPAPTAITLSPSNCSSQAKLSADCLSLRSDFKWQSACSHLAVEKSWFLPYSVFYYEVTLITSDQMRFGWANLPWQIESEKLGESDLSFAYDGVLGCIWNKDIQWRVSNHKRWQAGDVIGCLLDLNKKKPKFQFYQNGEPIQLNGEIYSRISKELGVHMAHVYTKNDTCEPSRMPFISLKPYQAALSLGPYQQVTVNFGSTKFRYPPECQDFWNFQEFESKQRERQIQVNNYNFKNVNVKDSTVVCGNSNIGEKGETENQGALQGFPSLSTNPTTAKPSFIIKEPAVCQVCKQQTNLRRRTLEGCPHFAFCNKCSSKDIFCPKCPP